MVLLPLQTMRGVEARPGADIKRQDGCIARGALRPVPTPAVPATGTLARR